MNAVPRVALIARGNVFGFGGVARSVVRIARGLVETGRAEVDVVELRPGLDADLVDGGIFDVTPEPIGEGVRLYRLRAWCSSPNQSEREFSVHLALIELCTRRGYDLLHGMYASTAGFAATYAAVEHGVPAVVSLRGNDIHRDVFDGPKFGQLRWALEHATAITSVSAEGLRRAEILTDCAGKGSVILNSIDPSSYRDGVAHVADGQPLIGSLAKFRAKKGLPTLIQAFRQVCTQHPGARLLLVGGIVNDERDAMLGLITDAGIADRVTVTGYVEQADAMRYLRGMDVFVLSSIHEGCPNALLEAMAAGVPIVATRCGAVPEMLIHGEEAILVPPGSAEEMAAGIGELLRSNPAGFAERARQAVMARFGPECELAAFEEVYRTCLGRRWVSRV
jgi:glycosyltransferase involved in cell wall biosynthesis